MGIVSSMAPSRAPYEVTPHATNPLPVIPKALYIGGAGNITLRGAGRDSDTIFVGLPAGFILDVAASHVRSSGTTATNIVALA